MMYYYGNHPFGGGGWIFTILVGAIVLILFIGFFKYLLKSDSNTKETAAKKGNGETPIDILKMRYAKGEIKKEEFETMKKDLS